MQGLLARRGVAWAGRDGVQASGLVEAVKELSEKVAALEALNGAP